MVSMVVYNPRKDERDLIVRAVRQAAASLTEEQWQLDFFEKREQMEAFIQEEPLLDLAGYDVSPPGSIEYLEKLRRQYGETLLLLIADPSMSPVEYIRPTILASSLMIRPISSQKLADNMSELVEKMLENSHIGREENLIIETREGKTYIPLSKIYYFEAREKKIYLRLKKQELTFYETIEHLAERLPANFIRCHRSFIVCRSRIQKVMLSKNLIELEQGIEVPLSRSYKTVFKEMG